jgi:hypothetical protein
MQRLSAEMASILGPSPAESLQRFLETEDLSLLEKPLVFDKAESYKSMQCCTGVFAALATAGLSGEQPCTKHLSCFDLHVFLCYSR